MPDFNKIKATAAQADAPTIKVIPEGVELSKPGGNDVSITRHGSDIVIDNNRGESILTCSAVGEDGSYSATSFDPVSGTTTFQFQPDGTVVAVDQKTGITDTLKPDGTGTVALTSDPGASIPVSSEDRKSIDPLNNNIKT